MVKILTLSEKYKYLYAIKNHGACPVDVAHPMLCVIEKEYGR